MDRLLSLALVLACVTAVVAYTPTYKQLSGDPSEFAGHILPSPVQAAQDQQSAFINVRLSQSAEDPSVFSAKVDLPVDSSDRFAFTFFSPLASEVQLALADPTGKQIDLSQFEVATDYPLFDDGTSVPGTAYLFKNPVVGVWSLSVVTSSFTEEKVAQVRDNTYPNAAVLLFNENALRSFSYMNSYDAQRVGQQIGVVARMSDSRVPKGSLAAPRAVTDVVESATLDVFLPDGVEVDLQMHDDGEHFDELAGDGVYGATLTAAAPGQYLARAVMKGLHSDGTEFLRTTEHIIEVVDDDLSLTGKATAVSDGKTRIQIQLEVSEASDNKYRAYAEVWGVDANGAPAAICWIGGLVNVAQSAAYYYVPLELDLNWAARASVSGPYTLKNVYLQDVETLVPITRATQIPVAETGRVPSHKVIAQIKRVKGTPEITEEMRLGVRPPHIQAKLDNYTAGAANLVLLHGYCSSDNPWQDHASIFTNAAYFLNPDANLGHDEFALKVAEFTEGLPGFSGIGHSQGGTVLLHLNQFYWSSLDIPRIHKQRLGAAAGQMRLIQSVGTPYQGCSGAGSAANLIKIFGAGCGANDDLTVDGSLLWLAGITPAERAEVYYYTTTYKQGKLFGDYCNLAVNLVLGWPNDGTTELDRAHLPGGNGLGNKEKWCHTTDMGYPAQYDDPARNAEMNTYAAR